MNAWLRIKGSRRFKTGASGKMLGALLVCDGHFLGEKYVEISSWIHHFCGVGFVHAQPWWRH